MSWYGKNAEVHTELWKMGKKQENKNIFQIYSGKFSIANMFGAKIIVNLIIWYEKNNWLTCASMFISSWTNGVSLMLENISILGVLVSKNQEWSQICTDLEWGLTYWCWLKGKPLKEFRFVNFLALTQNLKVLACNCQLWRELQGRRWVLFVCF